MAAGEFSKEFDVDVKNSNSNPEKDRVLFLNLTSVTGSKNPLFVVFVASCSFYFETHRVASSRRSVCCGAAPKSGGTKKGERGSVLLPYFFVRHFSRYVPTN